MLPASPPKIASPIRKWPMLSSASCGIAAIGTILSKVRRARHEARYRFLWRARLHRQSAAIPFPAPRRLHAHNDRCEFDHRRAKMNGSFDLPWVGLYKQADPDIGFTQLPDEI